MANYHNPVKIYFGMGEVKNLFSILGPSPDINNILLITGSRSLQESGHLDCISEQLKDHELNILSHVPANPDVNDIWAIKKKTDTYKYDCILAVGGGSVIDTGKALVALQGNEVASPEDIRNIVQQKTYCCGSSKKCLLIAVPTTAGTGSEVTSWATLWDKEKGIKYSLESPGLYPEIALVDPSLTLSLPKELTASSALDALSHATEAYWSRNSNEIVRMYALRSINFIAGNLENLLENLDDLFLREKVAYGSLFAGLAFSNTKTTACHSISYPLTLLYGINHGTAVSLTLGKMLVKNESSLVDGGELLRAYGVSRAREVQEFVERVFQKAGLPCRLRDYGVAEFDLPTIADKSFTPGRMDNNPVDLDKQYIVNLLQSIY